MNFYTQLWKQFMRITILSFSILLTIGLLYVQAANVSAQSLDQRINIKFDHENLYDAVKKIEQATNMVFAYDTEYLGLKDKFVKSSNFHNEQLEAILNKIFTGTNITFKQGAGNILLVKKPVPGKISGRVTDEGGLPLPGATVIVTGTNNATVTNANGFFTMNLEEGNYSITVSFVGYIKTDYKNITVKANQNYILNAILKNNALLEEVNVSYGKQLGREITGSIAVIKTADLADIPANQFAQELQGKVAGVEITQNNGAPGRGFQFRIRGAASLSLTNQPLFVIDGMPITGSINNINPDEIESFTVLKDASATALYGSRASNGVVLITTKHAKAGDSKVTFDAYYGIQAIPQKGRYKLMNAQQWAQFENEYYQDKLAYEPASKPTLDPVYQNPGRYGAGTNWFDVITRKAPTQSYNLTVATAREHSQSTVVVGYINQQGVVVNTGMQQFSLRINQDLSLANDKVKIGFNIAPSYHLDHNNRIATEGVGNVIEKVSEASPLTSPYNPDGSYTYSAASPGQVANINPLATLMETVDNYKTTRILGNGYLNYEIIKGLTLKTNIGIDKGSETRDLFIPSAITTSLVSTGTSSYVDNYSYTAEAYLNYKKTFFKDHNIEALVGYSAQKFSQESNSINGSTWSTDAIPYLSQATIITSGTSNTTAYSLLSTIGRLNYDYKGKYILSAAIRNDGSSRFGIDRKYGYFPSVSAGWILSDEKFMDNFKFVNFLKVRASYGLTGNNNLSNYAPISQIGSGQAYNYTFNNVLQTGAVNSTLGNAQLAWERNKQLDIGLDISLLKDRISFTYDYYHKLTDGLIQNRPIPVNSGFTSLAYNIGAIKFWGHEFTVNTTNLNGRFKWTSSFNISFDRNLVTSLVSPGYIIRNNTISSDYDRTAVGKPLGMFYGFVFQGLYKDAADLANSPKQTLATADVGTIKFKDVNGDGIIDANDRTYIGNPNPKFRYGFTNNFNYKQFSLNITMAGSYGNQILNADKWAYLTNMDGARGGLLAAVADRWRSPSNPGSGIYPRTETGTTSLGRDVESQWVEDGSYIAVKNINLGYTVPLKGKGVVNNLRVYLSITNALFFTKYSGLNPEVSLNGLNGTGEGIDENSYPVYRTYSMGVSASFK
ncbi:TonB-dependent receptor [Mucilaginibacter sp.]|uniref:TonB-dependent receptor n=1 Tax=Mucilaginibacter sp. TaxID=1882438 RepID=UPI00261CA662|nr:TonB-dependent receptor [Mucilaginibacter sp.]MDB4924629.1 TonB-dependent receptor [Mucilaginibacter sp.]